MLEIEQQIYFGNLLEVYGGLLTSKQRDYMELYYKEDFSLAEIAEKYEVSRAAVHNQIKASIAKMNEFEQAMNLLYIRNQFLPQLEQALASESLAEAKKATEALNIILNKE